LLVYSHRYSRKKEFTKGSAGGGAPLRELFEIHSLNPQRKKDQQ
jgi:hypothetical protein